LSLTFYNPIITRRRSDNSEPLIAKTDVKKIINQRIVLDEIPDKLSKCTVTGSIGGVSYTWYEISSGIPSLDTTAHTGTFLVDYLRGLVDFSSEANGEIVTVSSMGSGCQYFPANRIYSQFSDLGNGNYNIIETIQDIVDHLTNLIPIGTWSSATTYSKNNIINYNNFSYISLQDDNANHIPVGDIDDTYWQLLSGINNFENKDNWNGATQYYKNNIIFYLNFLCLFP
jgi:hypothetical protein